MFYFILKAVIWSPPVEEGGGGGGWWMNEWMEGWTEEEGGVFQLFAGEILADV